NPLSPATPRRVARGRHQRDDQLLGAMTGDRGGAEREALAGKVSNIGGFRRNENSQRLLKRGANAASLVEPWGFEPQIQPCHGRVIPFHYGPGIGFRTEKFSPARRGVNPLPGRARLLRRRSWHR